jgi:lipopolysaccharide export system protein LptA
MMLTKYGKFYLILMAMVGAIALTPVTIEKNALAQTNNPTGSITVRSDVQEANSVTGVITAKGNVQINYPTQKLQATATQAQYFSKERRLVLTGNVYVLQDGNSIRAENLTYLIDEGRFIATPTANRQVESTYIVTDEKITPTQGRQ